MSFYQRLNEQTRQEREQLYAQPLIRRALRGEVTLPEYRAFLTEAYHHVRHTVPLLMATGARLRADQQWLQAAVAEYISEELGHEFWILNDIEACGGQPDEVRKGKPGAATELMVAYAYDSIARVSPLAFFGMVHVLEGTSIALADDAAGKLQQQLGLPSRAFSYLTSHGALDQEHVVFFQGLMDRLTNEDDQAVVIHAARRFYGLYGNIFRHIDQAAANQDPQARVA